MCVCVFGPTFLQPSCTEVAESLQVDFVKRVAQSRWKKYHLIPKVGSLGFWIRFPMEFQWFSYGIPMVFLGFRGFWGALVWAVSMGITRIYDS